MTWESYIQYLKDIHPHLFEEFKRFDTVTITDIVDTAIAKKAKESPLLRNTKLSKYARSQFNRAEFCDEVARDIRELLKNSPRQPEFEINVKITKLKIFLILAFF